MIPVVSDILSAFLALAGEFFNTVFGSVDFGVLWRWLPSDIGAAASALIALLFGLALIRYIRTFLPF